MGDAYQRLESTNDGASSLRRARVFGTGARTGNGSDLLIFDPPYSPRQISECYKSIGREVGMEGTQNGRLYKRVRDAAMPLMAPDAIVLSFGCNSAGMGEKRGFEIIEIMLVAHGAAHNDTICVAEKRIKQLL